MKPEEIEAKVKAEIKFQLGVHDEQIVREASFVDDLGADSLDIVELIMALEEAFDICIQEEDAENLDTVGKAIDYIKERVGKS